MYEKYLEQLEEAGKIRNLKDRSISCYKNYVSYFLKYQGKNPEELTCQDVRTFLLAKKEEGLKATTLNLYNSAIRFFYRNVLHILWDDITVPRMILEHKLPTVLTSDEIDRLLDAIDDIKYKAMFATMYSSGMRVSEVIHLHYDDISRSNMQIHVRDTKNRMDRYTILSKRCLDILTQYWFEKGRPRGILFPNKFTGNYLTVSTLEQVMRRAVSEAELPAGATPHSLRHSFATHLMEQGVERQNIEVRAHPFKSLLGTNIDKAFIFAGSTMPYANRTFRLVQVQIKHRTLVLTRCKVVWYRYNRHLASQVIL